MCLFLGHRFNKQKVSEKMKPLELSSQFGNGSNDSGSCVGGAQHVSITVLLCLVFFLGFLLNTFSLWVFCCRMPCWSCGTTLQFHLALSDAIATPVTPMMAVYFAMGNHWPFGRFLCQVKIALLISHFYGSTIFLTLISIHRYVAVVHFNRGSCMKRFLLPFLVSAVCYGRLVNSLTRLNISTPKGLNVKVKSQRMIAMCLLIFGMCFLPLNVVRTVGVVLKKYYPQQCKVLLQMETAYYASWILAGVNSCLDPLLYCFGTHKVREAFQSFRIGRGEVMARNDSETTANQ
ncbi:P2Y purinoceptor 2 isoform X3 [Eleginops maclovinus]|uniref:P2Y purinoceptor 2 isoform X3 n=1 Tax=Eleginops maclovinus TaxID=56733 RepID=UPI00308100AA